MSELPSDNMYDILSRIPVKSLTRIRCVSNVWRNFINDPHLETMHAKRATSTAPTLIMFHQNLSDCPNSSCTLSFLERNERSSNTCTREVTKKPQAMEFMCTNTSSRYPNGVIFGSCNGLMYSSQRYPDVTTLVVIHPLTRERYELPPMKITPFSFLHSRERSWGVDLEESTRVCVEESSGLGFDGSTNTYKMVCVVLRLQDESIDVNQLKKNLCAMVHVLGTNTWRKIPHAPCGPVTGEGVFVNECLHWLTSNEFHNVGEGYLGRRMITFDMAKEEFGVMNPPHEGLPSRYDLVIEQLVDLNGELGYVYNIVDRGVEVWVLKERGWVMHCEFEHKPPLANGLIKVLGVWNEKGDVLMTDRWNHVFVFDLESGGLYEVRFDGWEEGAGVDIRMYRSSLFSTRYSIRN